MTLERVLVPLRALARQEDVFPPQAIVCHNAHGPVSWAELQALIAQWEQQIATMAGRFFLLRLDAGDDLLACLLALWRTNRVAVLASQDGFTPGLNLSPEAGRRACVEFDPAGLPAMDIDAALVLFTSGSSGAPVAVVKSLAQLDAELGLLEFRWGGQVTGGVFATMVSRRHLYGLPFSLLWPAARGSAFVAQTLHYTRSLEQFCARFAVVLVCSPVQLDNLPDNADWPALRHGLMAIFSAGAPLSERAAQLCRARLVPVAEIYGSTETGAVAWRDRTVAPEWTCLPGITVAAGASGDLLLRSPCLNPGELSVADCVEIVDEKHFRLSGRTDRIAKVGGKRVALAEVESRVLGHPWVEAARALQLEQRKGRIGIVLVLTGAGRAALIDRGRNAVNRLLSDHLRPALEPVAIPRYWRYAGRLPVNQQGKTSQELLVSLFHADSQPRYPQVLEQHRADAQEVVLLLRIPDNLFYFSGHFPGNPVLPGVAQIAWVEHFGRECFPRLRNFKRLEALKFQHILQPGDLVTLSLNWDDVKCRLLFSFASADVSHSSGRLVYAGAHG